ncbi:MAG: DUF58 domain-containing protein [Verrucomicrobiales bacterium]
MATAQHKYLRPEDIRQLASYEFAAKALAEGYLSGRHRSRARGASTEFHEYRQFVAGDDRALIDWRAFARSDRLYLRTFEQETNLECHIFLDSSASMGFDPKAPSTKLDYASFFAAALSYLVIHRGDRVSLQIFDQRIREFFPPGGTTRHLHGILGALEKNRPGEATSAAEALKRSFPLLRRRGTLVVISDFFDDPAAIFSALSPYLHRGFKVHLVHVLTPAEIKLPPRGLATFVDMESGERLVAHTDNLEAAYRRAMADHISGLRTLAHRRGVSYLLAPTDTSYFAIFDHLMR